MGFLDGDLAEIVGTALVDAGMSLPAILTKVTPVPRDPTHVTAATGEIATDIACEGFVPRLAPFFVANSLIKDANRVVKLYGSTIAGGAVPTPGDRITIDGSTGTIVNDDGGKQAISVDAARAIYTCQCR